MPNKLNPTEVQMFLDNVEPGKDIAVIFLKADESQRTIVGSLQPSDNRQEQVPILTKEGFKSFNVSRVLWIGYPDQFQSLAFL